MSTDFYSSYLRELEALDQFFAKRRDAERWVVPEDPDVRRLMESLAFFSARTRANAANELRVAVDRLTQGLLDDFVAPQPARALVEALPGPGLIDRAFLPRGTRVRLRTEEGELGDFSTMRDVTIRPLRLDQARLQVRGDGYRVLIRLRAFGPCKHVSEPLSIHFDLLGDYERSRQLLAHFERHLKRVGVVYGDPPGPNASGAACDFAFGEFEAEGNTAQFEAERRSQHRSGAVAKIRQFLHFPSERLRLEVALTPPESESVWHQAWLCLDLDDWPENQAINRSTFRLHMIPIENLFSEYAEPFKADGTQTRFPILPWNADPKVAFHSVLEVQQERATGLEVVLPSHLAAGEESWDFDQGMGSEPPALLLRLPQAFLEPRVVMVGAAWYQPGFDLVARGKLEPELHTRRVEGVEFRVHGSLVPHRGSPLDGDPRAMLHVLSRRAKRELSRGDLVMLMLRLGADARSYHGGVADEIGSVTLLEEPASVRNSGGGLRHIYLVGLNESAHEPERRGLVDDYLRCAELLLDAWSNNPATVRVDDKSGSPALSARST